MTGPEHYREAEYLLAMSIEQRAALLSGDPTAGDAQEPDRIVALAQVHATLALAAAVVDGPAVMRPEDRDEWDRATGRLS